MPRDVWVTVAAGALVATAAASCSDEPAASGSAGDTHVSTPADSVGTGSSTTSADAGTERGADDPPETEHVSITVTPSPHSPIAAAIEVAAEEPVSVAATASAGDHVVEVPRHFSGSNELVVPVVGLRESSTYALDIRVGDADGGLLATTQEELTTGELPEIVPTFEVDVDPQRSQPGVTLIEATPYYPPGEEPDPPVGNVVVAIDDDGEVVWYYRNTDDVNGVEPTSEGTFVSHYFPVGVRELDLLGNVVGNWQVVPGRVTADGEAVDDSAPVWEAPLEATLRGNPDDAMAIPIDPDWIDLTTFHHDIVKMPDGNLLALSTTNHPLSAAQRSALCPDDPVEFQATSDVVVEFEPDGTVVRTLDLWDAIDIDEVPGAWMCQEYGLIATAEYRDWTHANAVIYDEQRDAVIVSVRHTDQVIALDHLDDAGPQSSVRWILGAGADALALTGDPPLHQHAVELQDDGTILLYDNGNDRPGTSPGDVDAPTYSRAVLFEIDDNAQDPTEWSALQLWEHRMSDLDGSALYAHFLGDADRLPNGNVLINHGGIDPEGGYVHAVIVEVDPVEPEGGDIVWSTELGTEEAPFYVYRAERLPTLYFGPDVGG
jgi:arylsulfate sulfotransferase